GAIITTSTITGNYIYATFDFQTRRGVTFGGGGEIGGGSSAGFYKHLGGNRADGIRTNGHLFYNAYTKTTFVGREIPDVDAVYTIVNALVGSTVGGVSVENLTARDAFNVPITPFNIFVEDDGDGD